MLGGMKTVILLALAATVGACGHGNGAGPGLGDDAGSGGGSGSVDGGGTGGTADPCSDTVAPDPDVQQMLPTTVDTTFPATPGQTIHVAAGGDLQAALDAAQPGDRNHDRCRRHVHRPVHPAQQVGRRLDRRAFCGFAAPGRGHARDTGGRGAHAEDPRAQHRERVRRRQGRAPFPPGGPGDDARRRERDDLRAGAARRRRDDPALRRAARHRARSPLRPRHAHRLPEARHRHRLGEHRGHRFVRLRLPRRRPGRAGHRLLQRPGPVQDRQQLPRGLGRESDLRRRRSEDCQPRARRHRDPPQLLLQAAELEERRPELRRHALEREEPPRAEERAARAGALQRVRAQLVRRTGGPGDL